MKVYVVMVADRHVDPYCELFSTPEAAINYANEVAASYASYASDINTHEPPEGWLYYATYSEEDSVWVLEREVNYPTERVTSRT